MDRIKRWFKKKQEQGPEVESAPGTAVDQSEIIKGAGVQGPDVIPVIEGEEDRLSVDKDLGDMTADEYTEHMSRLRSQSVSSDFDKILKRLEGSTLYGAPTDLGDLQELVCVSYALGIAEGGKAVRDRQKFKYTRRHKNTMH